MKHLRLLLQISLGEDFVCLPLCLAEYDCSTMAATIKIDNVSDDSISLMVRTVQRKMLDCLRGADFCIFDEVNEVTVGGKICPG